MLNNDYRAKLKEKEGEVIHLINSCEISKTENKKKVMEIRADFVRFCSAKLSHMDNFPDQAKNLYLDVIDEATKIKQKLDEMIKKLESAVNEFKI